VTGALLFQSGARLTDTITCRGLIDRDSFKELFSSSVPLLRAGVNKRKIILAPLMRYVLEGCCENPAHCINRNSDYMTILGEGVAIICEWLDDQSYLKQIHNFCVLTPMKLLDTGALDRAKAKRVMQFWTGGPVHMTVTGYEQLAQNLVEAIPQLTFTRSYSSQEEASTPQQSLQQQQSCPQPRQQKQQQRAD
jgi:hypothetical protein